MKRTLSTSVSLTLACAAFFGAIIPAIASTTLGTVGTSNRYAWSETAGWVDFGTTEGNVLVGDSVLSGYAYGENFGWISLNCANTNSCASNDYKVSNNSQGTLTGYAWSETVGWINFAPAGGGVSISSSGVFSGHAYSELLGWINFSVDQPVTTDWRPQAVRASSAVGNGPPSGGGAINPSNSAIVPGNVSTTTIATTTPAPVTPPVTNATTTASVPRIPEAMQGTAPADPGTPPPFPYKRQLWDRGEDIRRLQMFLNQQGFILAESGPGAPGHETSIFGRRTYAALIRFQKANGIPAVGYFGVQTNALMNQLYGVTLFR